MTSSRRCERLTRLRPPRARPVKAAGGGPATTPSGDGDTVWGNDGAGTEISSGRAAVAAAIRSDAAVGSLAGASVTRDRRQPVAVLRQPTTRGVEVAACDRPRDRAHLSCSHRPVIDVDDRADLDAGSAEEPLVGDVEL